MRSLLRRMRPNLARDVPACGEAEPDGDSGYPYGPSAYFAYIDAWRTSGTFYGLEFRA
jgi:hypothetical protein